MVVKYTKDHSVDRGGDYAKVYNVALNTGNNSGDSNAGNIVASGTCGTNLTWELTNEGELIIEGNGAMTSSPWYDNHKSDIKTVIIGEGVTSIVGDAFSGCTGLTSVTIPNSVTSIGGYAFDGCTGLTSVTIPEGVTSIGCKAFSGCTGLTSVTIPNSVTSIDGSVFEGCTELTSIIVEEGNLVYDSRENCNAIIKTETNELISGCQSTIIPNSVTNIGIDAFYGCTGLTSITIPEGVTSIGWQAFSGCTGLTSVTIPNSVASIGSYAFSGCTGLTSITIPESVTSIGSSAFSGSNNLTSIIVEEGNIVYDSRVNCNAIIETETNDLIIGCKSTIIPNSVTSIGYSAFGGCSSLTAITIPEGVTRIGDSAFGGCSSLTAITIPEGVTRIGDNAFNSCTNLTRITIPSSITNIDSYAFENTNLPIENNIRYADTWAVGVIDKTKDKYTLRDNTTGIADQIFFYCTNLTSITIPEGVKIIGNYAFSDCSSLTTITIPEGVTSIGWDAFSGCSSLTAINIPESVTSIANGTFSNTNLPVENNIRYADTWVVEVTDNTKDKYTLRNNTTGIADDMFQENRNMKEITLPGSLKHIGKYAFQNCTNLASLTIPNGVISIGDCSFMNCWEVPSVTIPSSVTSIGERAFTGRGNGTSIVVDANNTVYDSRENCNAIICTETNHLIAGCSSTVIPNSVVSIGGCAFMNCGITSVIIPNGVTRIKDSAFASSLLTSISIPNSVTDIERHAFASCRSLKTIICRNVVPPTCEEEAFYNVDMGACALEVPLNSVALYRETSPWSGFNISAIVPQTLVLNDGEIFENEENMIVEEITYTRTLSKTNTWNALYVPFEIPMTAEFCQNYDVAYFNDVHCYDNYVGEKENGVLGQDGDIDGMDMEVLKVKVGTVLNANYPYLIRAKNTDALNMNIKVEDATLYSAKETTISCSSVFMKFDVTGIYTTQTAGELKGEYDVYAISGGGWKQALTANQQLKPFRLYLKLTSIDGSPVKATEEAMSRINIRVQGEDTETGIDELKDENGNVKTEIFDLSGRRVQKAQKGIFIQNGKKVIM
jgi:hypothetical protein